MLATLDDFETRHGEVDDPGRAEALLDDASAFILDEVAGSEADWVLDEQVNPPAAIVAITVEVAYRAFSNPDALERTQVADIAAYWRSKAEDALYLTKRELRRLRRAAGLGGFRAIPLVSPYSGPVEAFDLDEE